MSHNFFLSHYNGDKNIAEIISKILYRLSLHQLSPWFSSDISENGGLKPGNIWFNEIIDKITESKVLIAIITPNSIERNWIYFESGIAQAIKNCEVVPVCIGVKRDDLFPPLGMYQCYQLTDYQSLKEFIGKLLNKLGVVFDEELAKPVLDTAIKELSKIEFGKGKELIKKPDVNEVILEIKNHIDKKLFKNRLLISV